MTDTPIDVTIGDVMRGLERSGFCGGMLAAIKRELERDPRLKSRNTRRGYLHDLGRFEDWRNHRPLTRLLVEEYAAHLQRAGRAPSGINRALAAIRWWARKVSDLAFESPDMARAQREEIVTQAARVAGISDVRGSGRAKIGRHIARSEIDALLIVCASDPASTGARDAAIIALAAATGMRRAEIAGLRMSSFRETDRVSGEGIMTFCGKGDKERQVNICGGAFYALRDWLAIRGNEPGPLFYAIRRGGHVAYGRGLSAQALADMLAKRCEQAGIVQHTTWQDFRRTAIGELLDGGIDVVTIQTIMGHASPATTSAYDRRPDETRWRALRSRPISYQR